MDMPKISLPRKNLVILRGVPGAGKSTLSSLFANSVLLEADQYRYVNGKYVFNPEDNERVHTLCRDDMLNELINGRHETVVVANVFAKREHLDFYLDAARKVKNVDIRIFVVAVERQGRDHYTSVHNVPPMAIDSMAKLLHNSFRP